VAASLSAAPARGQPAGAGQAASASASAAQHLMEGERRATQAYTEEVEAQWREAAAANRELRAEADTLRERLAAAQARAGDARQGKAAAAETALLEAEGRERQLADEVSALRAGSVELEVVARRAVAAKAKAQARQAEAETALDAARNTLAEQAAEAREALSARRPARSPMTGTAAAPTTRSTWPTSPTRPRTRHARPGRSARPSPAVFRALRCPQNKAPPLFYSNVSRQSKKCTQRPG
jgi:translation initiation factor IF-2